MRKGWWWHKGQLILMEGHWVMVLDHSKGQKGRVCGSQEKDGEGQSAVFGWEGLLGHWRKKLREHGLPVAGWGQK